jgi:5-methyltetrahydrofolate--homocysteine methyltransferase
MNHRSFLSEINNQIWVTDGATGTNLQKRGLATGQPSDSWVFENPKEIIQLHKDFIAAGSHIILTDTLAAHASAWPNPAWQIVRLN